MEINNKSIKNLKPNLQFYKKIKENYSIDAFDVYKLNLKDDINEGYLALVNNDSKNIDIYIESILNLV